MKMLHFINDLERRKSYLDLGYSSVFDYCVRKIGYSGRRPGAASRRPVVARRYPEVFGNASRARDELRDRSLSSSPFSPMTTRTPSLNACVARRTGRSSVSFRSTGLRSPCATACSTWRCRCRNRETSIRRSASVSCARLSPEVWRDRIPTEQKVFVQFLADEEFLELFEEVRRLMDAGEDKSFADVMKATLAEYRDRHSPVARQARRDARNGANGPDSRRREWKDATESRHIPDDDERRSLRARRRTMFIRRARMEHGASAGRACRSTTSSRMQTAERMIRRI